MAGSTGRVPEGGKGVISQTTLNGYLALIIGAAGPITAYLATINKPWAATATGLLTLIAAIARVWSGHTQTDAQPTGTAQVQK